MIFIEFLDDYMDSKFSDEIIDVETVDTLKPNQGGVYKEGM